MQTGRVWDSTQLMEALQKRLGPWGQVHWQYSSRHRRFGYALVTLPSGLLLPCHCQQTRVRISFGDVTGFEAVLDDRKPDDPSGCMVIIYQYDGQVRHKRCGRTILWILPPCVPLTMGR